MSRSFLTDEHVPSVFISTLRSDGYTVLRARDEFGEQSVDEELLRYCSTEGHILITHDKKDFSGETGTTTDHNGIIIYTDENYLRDRPEDAVRTIEHGLNYYTAESLENAIIWLDQWRQHP